MDEEQVVETKQAKEEVNVSNEVKEKARMMGWVGEDDYRGHPDKFVDAETFVKRGEEILPILKKNNESLVKKVMELEAKNGEYANSAKEFKEFIQNARDRDRQYFDAQLEQLKEAKRTAINEGDGDQVIDIDDKMEQIREAKRESARSVKSESSQSTENYQPDPDFIAWHAENNWYGQNEEMTAVTNGVADLVRKQNPTLVGRAFLDLVKEKVMKRFPEEFTNTRRNELSAVTPASRGVKTSGKKTYANLPQIAKDACDDFVAKGYLTQEEYVKNYDWS